MDLDITQAITWSCFSINLRETGSQLWYLAKITIPHQIEVNAINMTPGMFQYNALKFRQKSIKISTFDTVIQNIKNSITLEFDAYQSFILFIWYNVLKNNEISNS